MGKYDLLYFGLGLGATALISYLVLQGVSAIPPLPCAPGNKRHPVLCIDGTVIYEEVCSEDGSAWVASGEVCPIEKICAPYALRNQLTDCWNGIPYGGEQCNAAGTEWIPTGTVCPPAPPIDSILFLSGADSVYIGSDEIMTGTLQSTSGTPVVGRTVAVYITKPDGTNTSTSSYTTDANGQFSFSYTPATAGSYAAHGAFAGDSSYNPTSASAGFTASLSVGYDFMVVPSGMNYLVLDAAGVQVSSSTNPATAINSAISAAQSVATSAQHGVALISEGTYPMVDNIIMKSYVDLVGAAGPTVAYAGLPPGQTSTYNPQSTNGVSDTYSSMTFYNSSGVNLNWIATGSHGIRSNNADNFVISNVKVTGSGSIYLTTGNGNGTGSGGAKYNIIVKGCLIDNDRSSGIIGAFYVWADTACPMHNLTFERCISLNAPGCGFLVRGDSVSGSKFYDVALTDCYAYNCSVPSYRTWYWGPGFDFAERNTITNLTFTRCQADHCFEAGFHWEDLCPTYNCYLYDCVAQYNGCKPADFANGEAWCPVGPCFAGGYVYCGDNSSQVHRVNCHACGNTKGDITGYKCM